MRGFPHPPAAINEQSFLGRSSTFDNRFYVVEIELYCVPPSIVSSELSEMDSKE